MQRVTDLDRSPLSRAARAARSTAVALVGVAALLLAHASCSDREPASGTSITQERAVDTPPRDVAPERVIRLRADQWPPFNGVAGSEREGFMIEIARAVFEKHGYQVDYQTMPWARAVKATRAGEFDGLVGAFRSDVPDFVFPDEPLGVADTVIVVKKGSPWKYQGIESLSAVRLGTIKGYGYGEAMDAYVSEHEDDPSRIDVIFGDGVVGRSLQKLAIGRVDAVLDYRMSFAYEVERSGLQGQFEIAAEVSRDHVFIAFSPNRASSKQYAKMLSDGIVELRQRGKLDEILTRYGGRDWQQ